MRLERLAAIDQDFEEHLQEQRASAFAAITSARDGMPNQPAAGGMDLQARVQMGTRYVQIAENESERDEVDEE